MLHQANEGAGFIAFGRTIEYSLHIWRQTWFQSTRIGMKRPSDLSQGERLHLAYKCKRCLAVTKALYWTGPRKLSQVKCSEHKRSYTLGSTKNKLKIMRKNFKVPLPPCNENLSPLGCSASYYPFIFRRSWRQEGRLNFKSHCHAVLELCLSCAPSLYKYPLVTASSQYISDGIRESSCTKRTEVWRCADDSRGLRTAALVIQINFEI